MQCQRLQKDDVYGLPDINFDVLYFANHICYLAEAQRKEYYRIMNSKLTKMCFSEATGLKLKEINQELEKNKHFIHEALLKPEILKSMDEIAEELENDDFLDLKKNEQGMLYLSLSVQIEPPDMFPTTIILDTYEFGHQLTKVVGNVITLGPHEPLESLKPLTVYSFLAYHLTGIYLDALYNSTEWGIVMNESWLSTTEQRCNTNYEREVRRIMYDNFVNKYKTHKESWTKSRAPLQNAFNNEKEQSGGEALTVTTLRKKCKERGITGISKMTKSELLAALRSTKRR